MIFVAETNLTANDSNSEYLIPKFQTPYRNDQTEHQDPKWYDQLYQKQW